MINSTAAFISELVRAADGIARLTKDERTRLIQRAAATIANMREQTSILGPAPANDNSNDPLDVVVELREMARLIDIFAPAEIAERLTNAVDVLGIGQRLLERRAVVREADDSRRVSAATDLRD